MNILFYVSGLRQKLGGGSVAQIRLALALRERGHGVRFASNTRAAPIRGMSIERVHPRHYSWADVLVASAYANADLVRRHARAVKLPVVDVVHSALQCSTGLHGDVTVFASDSLRVRTLQKREIPGRHVVTWPLIDHDVATTPGDRVTLINLQPNKGAELFWQVVRAMPDVPFLAVKGGWGKQYVPPDAPDNVTVMDYVEDVREVYSRTGILLYLRGPDWHPDWMNGVGMTALEASLSGIPTIYHDGPGLVESVGDYGRMVPDGEPGSLVPAIRSVLGDRRKYELRAKALGEVVRGRDDVGIFEGALKMATEKGADMALSVCTLTQGRA